MFSPDGKWLAYISELGGDYDIYVTPFDPAQALAIDPDGPPPSLPRYTVSPTGGLAPHWSPDGRYLYYRQGTSLLQVRFEVDAVSGEPRFGPAEVLFDEPRLGYEILELPRWSVHPDGERFLVRLRGEGEQGTQLHVVVNWFRELEELLEAL